jgi:hypothetical protein
MIWPTFGGSRTAVQANIANDMVCVYESELLEGSNIWVGGRYFAVLGNDCVMRGRYLCPDGDHEETFELRRDHGVSKMADQGILRIGNELVSYVRAD